jgi:hypothetical protein
MRFESLWRCFALGGATGVDEVHAMSPEENGHHVPGYTHIARAHLAVMNHVEKH